MTDSSIRDNSKPLVSVLCRTVGRATLETALNSVNVQDWEYIEVILVDALNQGVEHLPVPALRSGIELQVVHGQGSLDRPAAANAALDAARGEFLIFLDDDDWIAPAQIGRLVREFNHAPDIVVCYSATRKTRPDGTLTEEIIATPFDHTTLRRDNFIPIHAAMFRRNLLDLGCRFDESMAVYEDWDFWLQAAEHGNFRLCPHVGAFYREGGTSETMLESHAARYDNHHPIGQARARIFHKWRDRWSGGDWNTLMGRLDQSPQLKALQDDLQRSRQEMQSQIGQCEKAYQELESGYIALNWAHEQLDRDVKAILASFSWRVTAPYRWLRHKLAVLRTITRSSPPASERRADRILEGNLQAGILFPAADNLTFGDSLTLQGWAWSLPVSESAPHCTIIIGINGHERSRLRFPALNDDIRDLDDARRIGFAHLLDIRDLTPGRHVLTLQAMDEQDHTVTVQRVFVRQDSAAWYRHWRDSQTTQPEREAMPLHARLNIVISLSHQTPMRALQRTLQSLGALKGENWRVLIEADSETDGTEHEETGDKWLSILKNVAPQRVRERLQRDASLTPDRLSSELLMFLEAGELLAADYLVELATHWKEDTRLLYSDHDQYDHNGQAHTPVFTFAWAPDLLLSRDYIGGVFVIAADSLLAWPAREGGAWRYRCLLDLAVANTLEFRHVSRVPKVLWSEADTLVQSAVELQRAVRETIQRHQPDAEVRSPAVSGGDPKCQYVRWPLSSRPRVSIIIPTTGNLRFLKPCLDSLAQTDYPDIELIILDNSRGNNPEGIQYARDKGALIVNCDEDFNWSRLNNIGAERASGEVLLFLNDDIEIIDPDWLTEMVRQAVRDDVGTVGCLLFYPNGAIQHGGVFLVDHGGGARHLLHRQLPGKGVYLQLDQCVREVSANTGACQMILRERFEKLGRFDETLVVAGNDIDLCLRALDAGWRNLWTPHSRLIHHESVSRQDRPTGRDEKIMWQHWRHRFLAGDPWFNPSLSLHREDCALPTLPGVPVIEDSPAEPRYPFGVNMVAYIRASMGLGEAARGNAAALEATGVNFGIFNYEGTNPSRMDNLRWQHREIERPLYDINLFHINADHIGTAMADLTGAWREGRYNIGFWAWEMPEFPDRWLDAFSLVDEVWVPSTYVNQAVATKSPVPVITIPHVIQIDMASARRYDRTDFGIPETPFVFISMFDTHSIAQRKNPFGAIHAFQKAFSPDDTGVHLVIKINNVDDGSLSMLNDYIGNYHNIQLIDQHLDRSQIDSLIHCSDCYVSLHRSEGFGLGPAEAMAMGKVALLTNWSGNTEYMTMDNCVPVSYTIKQLGTDYGPYEAYQHWASPDLAHAAAEMQALVADPERVRAIGEKAQEHIKRHFSAEAIGRRMRARLDSIQRQRH